MWTNRRSPETSTGYARFAVRLLACCPIVAFVGCVTVQAAKLGAGPAHAPIESSGVVIYRTPSQVPGKYEEVALLSASGDNALTDERAMYAAMKQKAGAMGANAIILESMSDAGAGDKIANALFGTPAERKGKAVAIYIYPTASTGTGAVTPQPMPDLRPIDSSRASVVVFDTWRLSVASCQMLGPATRCTIEVRNGSGDKKGFRLENVGIRKAAQPIGRATDFSYYPRAFAGSESTQGNCDPQSTCTVQLSFQGSPDQLSFSVSLFGASFGGTKQAESAVVSLPVPPSR